MGKIWVNFAILQMKRRKYVCIEVPLQGNFEAA